MLLLQLTHDLTQIPTVEMQVLNTDACKFYVDDSYKKQADEVIHNWEKQTGFEMEEDNIVKSVMANVNNYAEIVQTGDNNYEVHYKGGFFRGKHKFKWNNDEKKFQYTYKPDMESNSLSICSEALLKNLLFDIPPEDVIYSCDDIFRFQRISHVGSTYEKCVLETPDGDIELQHNNRIYAGFKSTGRIVKVKADGRRDSLSDQPPNPIIDNNNQCTIADIDKSWYVSITRDWINRFRGVKRMEDYKKDELLELAERKGLVVDKKTKKADLIKLLEESEENKMATKVEKETTQLNVYQRLREVRRIIREHEFLMDCLMPSNLGGKQYASIGQYYTVLHSACDKCGLDFSWEVLNAREPYKNLFTPAGKTPQHVWDVECMAVFTNIDNIEEQIKYITSASGSDICDKGISGGSTMAFRNWFDKNFTPKYLNQGGEIEYTPTEEKTSEPKVPAYIPPTKKEEIKKEVVETVQTSPSDENDIKLIIDKIMKVRELSNNDTWGEPTLQSLIAGNLSSADILSIGLKVDNKLDSLGVK